MLALSLSFITALIDYQGTLGMNFPGRVSYHFLSQVETLLNRSNILLQEPRSPDTILGDLSCRANHFDIQGLCEPWRQTAFTGMPNTRIVFIAHVLLVTFFLP